MSNTHCNNTSVAFQKKSLNPWNLAAFRGTLVFEEQEVEVLPVLMSIERAQKNQQMNANKEWKKKKEKKTQQKRLLLI